MHGTLGMKPVITKTRRGRKRAEGRRKPSGDLIRDRTDQRALVSTQPHRACFSGVHRFDQRAESYLGSLNLKYRISESENANKRHSKPDRSVGVTDEQYRAGLMYAGIVARYHAMCNAPRLAQPVVFTPASEKWQITMHRPSASPEAMWRAGHAIDDEKITDRYMRAYEAIPNNAAHKAVNRAVIQERAIDPDQLIHLRNALSALAEHFGLTNRSKR